MTGTASDVLPDTNRGLLEAPVVAHLAASRPDGSLQSNPVSFDWNGTHIKISQTKDRQKVRNVDHDLSERYLHQRPYPNHQRGGRRIIVHTRPSDGSAMAA